MDGAEAALTPVRQDPDRREDAMLSRLLPELAGKRALEIGCGNGRLTRKYAERGPSIRHTRAEEAMSTALARGWYIVEARDAFSFLHQADTLAAMRDHVASLWKHARFDEDSWRRAEASMDGRRAAVVQLREEV